MFTSRDDRFNSRYVLHIPYLKASRGTDSILPNARRKTVVVQEHAKQQKKKPIVIFASTAFRTK